MVPMKSRTTKGTKDHEGFWLQMFPPFTLAALVVNGFVNCTTTRAAQAFAAGLAIE
jgi:methyl coenzyme M reductase beta subunit